MYGSKLSRRVTKAGMIILPKTGDLFGRLGVRVDLPALIAQPRPAATRSYFDCACHLQQTRPAPQVKPPENRRNLGKFQTAV